MNVKVEYPKWLHHAVKDAVVVHSVEEKDALGAGWAESPAVHGLVAHPGVDSVAPAKTADDKTVAVKPQARRGPRRVNSLEE